MATGFLITNLSGVLKRINDLVNDHVLKTLYIQVYLKKLQPSLETKQWVSKKIFDVYSSTSQLYPNLDIRIILNELKLQGNITLTKLKYDIDLLILPKSYKSDNITSFINTMKNVSVILLEDIEDNKEEKNSNGTLKMYNNVVLGGTFDRLHAGHKILISQALLQCTKKLTIGVTDDNMIQGKILWELIEPCEKRIQSVKTFIEEVDNTVECNVLAISDMYGPTKYDPTFNMIVVSAETEKGGLKINQLRKENGLNELDICSVNIIEDGFSKEGEESKISSSNFRKRLLGTRLQEPQKKPGLSDKPYIIGLTGGICSGKSSIGEYLETLGAGLIDCDKVAHELYKSGSKLFFEIVQEFGKEIIAPNGEIDRKKLGGIVFKNQKKLETLNNMLWPNIMQVSKERCQKLYKEHKKNIIVLEAAVLIQAGWHRNVHEVWTAIIPREEAINRLMKRNKLTEEEAVARLQTQPSNLEQIAVANIVLCSLWSYEYTRKQVQNAWEIVNESLSS